MDLQNLKEHHKELLSFMENNGYCSTYIHRFRDEINRILADADSHRWQPYQDIYLEYLKVPLPRRSAISYGTGRRRSAGTTLPMKRT